MSGAEALHLTQANIQTTIHHQHHSAAVQLDMVIVGCCCPYLLASSRTDVINGGEEQVTGCMETFLAGEHGCSLLKNV